MDINDKAVFDAMVAQKDAELGQRDAEIHGLKAQVETLNKDLLGKDSAIETLGVEKHKLETEMDTQIKSAVNRLKIETEVHAIDPKYEVKGKSDDWLNSYLDSNKKAGTEKHGKPKPKPSSSGQGVPNDTEGEQHSAGTPIPKNWKRTLY